jgi:hypothetical protein
MTSNKGAYERDYKTGTLIGLDQDAESFATNIESAYNTAVTDYIDRTPEATSADVDAFTQDYFKHNSIATQAYEKKQDRLNARANVRLIR